jgi:hypothetical protein
MDTDIYLCGRCHIFALALHEALGYQIVWLFDEEAHTDEGAGPFRALVHAFCLNTSEIRIDSTGEMRENVDEDRTGNPEDDFGWCNEPNYVRFSAEESRNAACGLILPRPHKGEIDKLKAHILSHPEIYGEQVRIPLKPKLTDREREILQDLRGAHDDRCPTEWCRAMDVGGRDGSHHSYTLAKLTRAGLVERKKYGCFCKANGELGRCRCKGSCGYRLTEAGRAAIA